MTFTPLDFDGDAAAQRMIARGTAPYLSCLETVATAIKGNINSDNPGAYGMAIDGWDATPNARRHAYSRNMPSGRVLYAATADRPDGHVVITLGGDRCVSTDTPTRGRIAVTTVSELAERMEITPLGWTDWFLGHNLITQQKQENYDMRVIYNTDNPDDATRRALIGETSFQVITAAQSLREGKFWGATVNVTQGEWDAAKALVDARLAATAPSPTLTPAALTSLASKIATAVAAKLPKKLTGTLS